MGLFDKWKRKKKTDEVIAWNLNNAQDEEMRRYYEAQADKEYQAARSAFYELTAEIKETYTILSNVGSFAGADGDKLIERCSAAIELDDFIREKRDYYDSAKYEYCEPYKILSMVHEKRGDYQRAAITCVLAIQNGYTKDGTSGGMRGRLARMIKKGNLPISENMKEILNLH